MDGHDQFDLLMAIAQGSLIMVTDFWRQWAKIGIVHLVCAPAFHNGWEVCNMDARVNTADDLCTADKNLTNFGPSVTPEFLAMCLRRDG